MKEQTVKEQTVKEQTWFRPDITEMEGYAPGEWPPLDSGVLKLNSNENPHPPSPKVIAALANLKGERLRRYPDPLATEFRQAVSDTFRIPTDWIIAGNGSDDLLTLIVRACAQGSQRPLAYPTPTYVLYRTLAAIQPAHIIEVPYDDDWQLPVQALLEANAAVTFIATPNSPSGHLVPIADLRALATGLSGVLVIDEAYVDFAGDGADQASLALVRDFENVMVLRTLSKGYALAGLRVGFGFAQPALLEGLLKVKDSYNVDAIALHLATAAIKDRAYVRAIAQKVMDARGQLAKDLAALGFCVGRSHTNFLLATPPNNKAKRLYQQLKEQQIMIRYFAEPKLDNKLRITVGTSEQNARLVNAITQLLSE
ncbi:MAG: histidinol-phosphate transaminase [Cyanobacteria bacterium J06553_1]